MRKIISKKIEDKKRRRNQFFVGGILIFLMVFSVLGYSFRSDTGNNEEKINYNEIKFTKESGFWTTNFEGLKFYFKYNPKEIEITNFQLNLLSNYYNKPLYISSENSEATNEIYKNLFYYNQIVQRIQNACLEGEECEGNLPIKNCEDNIIIFKESENNEIIQEKNCVFIKGKKEDLVKLSDDFLFKIIGITQ